MCLLSVVVTQGLIANIRSHPANQKTTPRLWSNASNIYRPQGPRYLEATHATITGSRRKKEARCVASQNSLPSSGMYFMLPTDPAVRNQDAKIVL